MTLTAKLTLARLAVRQAQAKARMGNLYLCHKDNHVRKLAQPIKDTDVARHMKKDT